MKVRLVSVAMLFTLLCALVFVPVGTASAKPKPEKGNNSLKSVKAKGKVGDATLAVTKFSVNAAGKLVASGTVTHATKGVVGTFSDAPVSVLQQSALQQQPGTCQILRLVIEPIFLNLLGLVIETSRIELTITADPNGGLLGALLCAVANLLNDQNALAGILNQILGVLGGSLSSGTPLFGLLPLSIDRFFAGNNGQLFASFFVRSSTGTVAGPFVAPVQVQQVQESCTILRLVLGPINLNILGLIIDIPDQITIEIRGERGPGNLLGNLLCAIVGLLDQGASQQAVASKLNQLLKEVG